MKQSNKTEMSTIIDNSMALIMESVNNHNKALANVKPEPKFSNTFLDDSMCISRIKAFVEYVRQHHPKLFEDAYSYADESVVDNE